MLFCIDNKRQERDLYGEGEEGTGGPVVGDVGEVEDLLEGEVDEADEDAVQAEDEHRADGDNSYEAEPDGVKTSAEVDDGIDGEQVHRVIEQDVQHEAVFVDVPVEEEEAQGEGGASDGDVFSDTCRLQPASLTEQVTHKEEANAAHKTVEGDVRCEVPVFVGTVEHHADDTQQQHDCFSVSLSMADVRHPVHQEQGEQEPSHAVEFAGER